MQQNPLFSQNDNENENYIKGSTTSSMISASYKTSKIENDENQINNCLKLLTFTKFAVRWKSLRDNTFIDKVGNITLDLSYNLNRTVFVNHYYKNKSQERSDEYLDFTYYTHEISYQRYKWLTLHSFNDFKELHNKLQKKYPGQYTDQFKHLFEHLTETSYFLENLIINGRLTYGSILGMSERLAERQWKGLRIYLQLLCDEKVLFQSVELNLFLNIGVTSLRPELGRKGYAGFLKRPSTVWGLIPDWVTNRVLEFVGEKCWVVLHDNCIAVYESSFSVQPTDVIEVDFDFKFVRMGKEFLIRTKNGMKYFRAYNKNHAIEWEDNLISFYTDILRGESGLVKKRSNQSKSASKVIRGSDNMFKSFSPERRNISVKLFTYSKDYMASLTLSILDAKKEICIASWKLSPTILLTRDDLPPIRLDHLLLMKAQSGIIINILLYQEISIAAQGNDSASVQTYLESLHPNICCQRHGCGLADMKQWSHHEKLVIIDRSIAYVGGIDLAVHRWDDEKHQLFDIKRIKFPGKDYSNPAHGQYLNITGKGGEEAVSTKRNILNAADAYVLVVSKLLSKLTYEIPRLPWHDMTCSVSGSVAMDIACHFIQRWNIINVAPKAVRSLIRDQGKQWRLLQSTDDKYFGICAKCRKIDIEENLLECPSCGHDLGPISPYIDKECSKRIESPDSSLFTNITYSIEYFTLDVSFFKSINPLFQSIPIVASVQIQGHQIGDLITKNSLSSEADSIDFLVKRGLRPQVGDILLSIDDDNVSHFDEGSIANLLATKSNGLKKFVFRRFYSMNRIDEDAISICENSISKEYQLQISILYYRYASRINSLCLMSNSNSCTVQALRSTGPWSLGWKDSKKECSIYNCYMKEIENAEHYIYIENQYFISNLADDTAQNLITEAIVKKIVDKALNNKKFYVTVILPQYPTGNYLTKVSTQSIMHYQNYTIRGTLEILQKFYQDEVKQRQENGLQVKEVNVLNFIDFFCLRKGETINDYFTSSQIYVHDKIMIVDDKVMIIGSANINDRSMMGNRDSEVAVRIEDNEKITIEMNGKPYQASKLIHQLRVKLMGQHVGVISNYENYNSSTFPKVELISKLKFQQSIFNESEFIRRLLNEKLDSVQFQNIEKIYINTDMKDHVMSYECWRNTALYNTLIWKVLDGECDVYCAKSLPEFTNNINTHGKYLNSNDDKVIKHASCLKGCLLLFPTYHLQHTNLKSAFIPPSLVT